MKVVVLYKDNYHLHALNHFYVIKVIRQHNRSNVRNMQYCNFNLSQTNLNLMVLNQIEYLLKGEISLIMYFFSDQDCYNLVYRNRNMYSTTDQTEISKEKNNTMIWYDFNFENYSKIRTVAFLITILFLFWIFKYVVYKTL